MEETKRRELDSRDGRRLEADMLKIALRGGFRIIGPNCVGTCVPAIGKPLLGPTIQGTLPPLGDAAFASQSGGIAGELVEMAAARGIGFGKLISFGNGSDLDAAELLDYCSVMLIRATAWILRHGPEQADLCTYAL